MTHSSLFLVTLTFVSVHLNGPCTYTSVETKIHTPVPDLLIRFLQRQLIAECMLLQLTLGSCRTLEISECECRTLEVSEC
jgi:hypothetical protein